MVLFENEIFPIKKFGTLSPTFDRGELDIIIERSESSKQTATPSAQKDLQFQKPQRHEHYLCKPKKGFLDNILIMLSFLKVFMKPYQLLVFVSGFLFLNFTTACASPKYPITDHYDGSKFYIKDAPSVKGFWDLLKWQVGGDKKPWPKWVDDNEPSQIQENVRPNEAWITYINHATHLIQLSNLNILTDPIFSERASPVSWAGPKRVRAPGVALKDLPKIDVVVISHNHYDHLDLSSLKEIDQRDKPLFLVGLGTAKLLNGFGIKNVEELDWWHQKELADQKGKIVFTPLHHWCSRGLFDRNQMLWGGFVIYNSDLKIYFAGDTGYGHFFKETQNKLGNMDVSIIPIGAYEPRWFMKEQHVNPEEAVQIHLDVSSKLSIGTHFGTFQLTDEGIDDPLKDLNIAKLKYKLDDKSFVATKNGKTIHFVKQK